MTDNTLQLIDEITDSLIHDAGSWSWAHPDRHFLIRHRSGILLWVSHEFRIDHPREIRFGFLARHRLKSAFKTWRRVHGAKMKERLRRESVDLVLMTFRGERSTLRNVA